jgi:hypothetical protein
MQRRVGGMDPQGLYMPRSIINAIEIKIFLDPQLFGDRKYLDNGDCYTSRNSVWLGEEVFFVVSTLIGNPDLGRLRRKPSLNYKKI